MTIDMLVRFGEWLRALSLSGPGGNAVAWLIVLASAALPALGLLWRGRTKYNWLLLLASAEILAGLYYLVNPTLLTREYPAAPMISLASAGCVFATLFAWAVLRGLQKIPVAEYPGRTMDRLLRWSSLLMAYLAVIAQGVGVWQEIKRVTAANTALTRSQLTPTYIILTVLALLDLLPTLLCCQILRQSGRLALNLETAPFGEETVNMAETLGSLCARIAALSVILCVTGNLLQFLFLPVLYSSHFNVSFPFASVLLAAVLALLCRYFRRAKAVSDDNETII